MSNPRIFRTVFSVTGILLLSKLFGFFKQTITAAAFGTTLETDIINLAQGLIGNLQYVMVQSLMTALITVYLHASNDRKERDRLVSNTIKTFLIFAAAISIVVMVFAPLLAKIIAPSYDSATRLELIRYLRYFAPVLILLALICIFQSVLQANKRFLPGEFVSLNQSVILIFLVLIFAERKGPRILGTAYYCYAVWNVMYLAVASRKLWKYQPGNPLHDPMLRKLLRMMLPLLMGYSVVYINQMVDKMLVSGMEEGAVTALSYAAVLSDLINTLIVTFGSMMFPFITDHISEHRDKCAAHQANRVASLLLLVFCPVSILTIYCAKDIVTIIFGHGAFDTVSIKMAAQALQGYGAMFVPLVLREVYARVQYGYQNTRSPMLNSSIAIIGNIVLSIVLSRYLGIQGITLASSLSVLLCGILNVRSAQQHNPDIKVGELLEVIPWLLLGSIGCCAMAYYLMARLVNQEALIRFLVVAVGGMCAHALLTSPKIIRLLRQNRSSTN